MLKKQQNLAGNITATKFAEYNQELYYDSNKARDTFVALPANTDAAITENEVQYVLQNHFKANKSTGLSPMPL